MIAPQPGTEVSYRSFAGDIYDAVVTGVSGECVNIEVIMPGCRDRIGVGNVPFNTSPMAHRGAWPKAIVSSA